jgi:hypothetical protein
MGKNIFRLPKDRLLNFFKKNTCPQKRTGVKDLLASLLAASVICIVFKRFGTLFF